MGYGPLGRISHPQLPDILLAVATFQVTISPFKSDLQGQAFRKLVAMRRLFENSGDLLTRFTTDVSGMADMAGYEMMVAPVWRWLVCPLLFRPFSFLGN